MRQNLKENKSTNNVSDSWDWGRQVDDHYCKFLDENKTKQNNPIPLSSSPLAKSALKTQDKDNKQLNSSCTFFVYTSQKKHPRVFSRRAFQLLSLFDMILRKLSIYICMCV